MRMRTGVITARNMWCWRRRRRATSGERSWWGQFWQRWRRGRSRGSFRDKNRPNLVKSWHEDSRQRRRVAGDCVYVAHGAEGGDSESLAGDADEKYLQDVCAGDGRAARGDAE